MQFRSRTQALVMPALVAALLAILSPMAIPVGPVPITLAVFAVFFAGAILPPLSAAASLAVYILLGVCGLPVFSGFRGGPQVLIGPTGGYIAGYFILAVGLSLAMRYSRRLWVQLAAGLGALAAFYLAGTLWYMLVMGVSFGQGLAVCVLPFILPDSLKLLAAVLLARVLRRRLAPGKGA